MCFYLKMSVFFRLYLTIFISKLLQQGGCSMEAIYRKHKGKYLADYVIRTTNAKFEQECATHCFRDSVCASINYKISGHGKGLCELNSKTLDEKSDEGTQDLEFAHLDIIKRDCLEPGKDFSPTTKRCDDRKYPSPSCKELLLQKASSPNGVYTMQLNISSSPYEVYCHMTNIPGCGSSGGWTLVLKVDGKKSTFDYNSPFWTNKESYAVEDGLEGLTEKESKLASYWNTPFKKLCLGMTVNNETKWLALDDEASSLYSVIAGAQFRATSAGRTKWMSMIDGSSLQPHCNQEGFNIYFSNPQFKTFARLGFVANNEKDCLSCDSWIGFGVYNVGCNSGEYRACGNRAICAVDNIVDIQAFGYIFVQ